jgi:hypothetical protein
MLNWLGDGGVAEIGASRTDQPGDMSETKKRAQSTLFF